MVVPLDPVPQGALQAKRNQLVIEEELGLGASVGAETIIPGTRQYDAVRRVTPSQPSDEGTGGRLVRHPRALAVATRTRGLCDLGLGSTYSKYLAPGRLPSIT